MKVAIVTGGTFGIGKGISLILAERGYQVVAFGLDSPQISSIAEGGSAMLRAELAERSLPGDVLEADVSKADDIQAVVDHAMSCYGRIDGLVNNAAVGPLGTVLDTSEEVWDEILAVNLKGMYLSSRTVLPHMIAAGGGAIVNIGSGAGWGKPNMAAYAASKGGMVALNMALAYDHFHQGIRVNMVIPGGGGIVTGMSVGRAGGAPNFFAHIATGTAAGRPAAPEDLGRAVTFLLSEDAQVISGTVLDVGCFAYQGGPVPSKPAGQPA